MRGRPLLEVFIFVLVWGALALPLWRLTAGGHAEVARQDEAAPALSGVHAWAELRFAHAPEMARLVTGTNVLWEGRAPVALRVGVDVQLPLNEGRIPVEISVSWPADVGQSVVELTLEPDGLPAQSRRLWGNGQAGDLWEFQWTR